MKSLREVTMQDVSDAIEAYNERWGDIPVGLLEATSGDYYEYYKMVMSALETGEQIPRPDIPDGVLVY